MAGLMDFINAAYDYQATPQGAATFEAIAGGTTDSINAASELARRNMATQEEIDLRRAEQQRQNQIGETLAMGGVEFDIEKYRELARLSPNAAMQYYKMTQPKPTKMEPVTLPDGSIGAFDPYTQTMHPVGMAGQQVPVRAYGGERAIPYPDAGMEFTPDPRATDSYTAPLNVPPEIRNNPKARQQYLEKIATARAEESINAPLKVQKQMAESKKADNVISAINKVENLVSDYSVGYGSLLDFIPGTDAKDLSAQLDTIKANIGFDRLQEMRESSPTGGALGQISDKERERLESAIASLDTAQSPELFRENLARVKSIYQEIIHGKKTQLTQDQIRAELIRRGIINE